MLTGNLFLNMLKKPELHNEIDKPVAKKAPKPKDKSIDKLISAFSVNGMTSRKWLIDNSELSSCGVDRCIKYLLETGVLKRSFIRMAGPYKVYNYEIKE